MDSHKKYFGMAAVLVIVGLIIGAAIAYPVGDSMGNEDAGNPTPNSETADTDGVTVGGAKFVKSKDIIDNAVNAKNLATLVSAVKAAGLVDTLKSEGPLTVFAPDNGAFEKLPAGTADTFFKPENKDMLASILTYHVVAGTFTAADLKAMASKGESLTSIQGGMLTPVVENNSVKLKDAKGNMTNIVIADVVSSNGVTHIINSVLTQ